MLWANPQPCQLTSRAGHFALMRNVRENSSYFTIGYTLEIPMHRVPTAGISSLGQNMHLCFLDVSDDFFERSIKLRS